MQVAVLAFDGFNEIDCFLVAGMINRLRPKGWSAVLTAPGSKVCSMNGLVVERQRPLDFLSTADAVIVASNIEMASIAEDGQLLDQLDLDPSRQLIAAQCSGAILLARLGLVTDYPACTDLATKPILVREGLRVLNLPFTAHGNVATAGGSLAASYLAAWVISRLGSISDAEQAIREVAPVGEKEAQVARTLAILEPSASRQRLGPVSLAPATARRRETMTSW